MFRPYQRFRIGLRLAKTGASFLANVNPTRQFLSPDRSQPSPMSQPNARPSSRDHPVGRWRTVVFPFATTYRFAGVNGSRESCEKPPSPDWMSNLWTPGTRSSTFNHPTVV